MAISVSITETPSSTVFGNKRVSVAEVTFDNSYPTGGEALTATDLGLTSVDFAITTVVSATGAGVNVANAFYEVDSDVVLVYDETPAQVANASDLSNVVVQVVAFGY